MDTIPLTGNLTIMKFHFSVAKDLQLHILTEASLDLKSNLLLATQIVDKVYFLVKINKATYNKGLALCRRTETQSSTLVHVASVVPSLTERSRPVICNHQLINFIQLS